MTLTTLTNLQTAWFLWTVGAGFTTCYVLAVWLYVRGSR